MSAKELIIKVIRNKVAMMNLVRGFAPADTMERYRHELTGMMVCLKNITSSDEFYCINYLDDGSFEFGYYDDSHNWWSIDGGAE